MPGQLIQTLSEFDPVLLARLWIVTTDNTTTNDTMIVSLNNRLQMELDEYFFNSDSQVYLDSARVVHVRCMAQILHIAVKSGLRYCPLVDTTVGQLRDFTKKLSESTKLMESFQDVGEKLILKSRHIGLDVSMRWGSTWEMMNSSIQMRIRLKRCYDAFVIAKRLYGS